ncbi:MAG: hypothetical protein UY40_C0010G0017 [candidate division CPR1 bacterium GW2011_GWC1_49_13]|uniref:Uncharacterized protein n=1 Tax=candidate division CPR1 bacterium GW2011_GWC1_49_13 TaxID=1618342 RepID=A0A0G1VHL2_9BACT|nr:MAG: hypothetical protein UY40_C0010G0017 [candidate division CPR1 bacterium GW2011_GWC1_49_13]
MKRLLFACILLFCLLFPQPAGAQTPIVKLDSIDKLEYRSFPQEYNVTGTVSMPGGLSNVYLRMILFINEQKEYKYGSSPSDYLYYLNSSSATFSLPWNIKEPGTYAIEVWSKYSTLSPMGSDSATVTVSLKEEKTVLEKVEQTIATSASDKYEPPTDLTSEPESKFQKVIEDVKTTTQTVVEAVIEPVRTVWSDFTSAIGRFFKKFW